MATTIIAEIGCNHNGDLDHAKRLADAARSSGADIVKTQTSVAHLEATPAAALAPYQGLACHRERSGIVAAVWKNQQQMIAEIMLSRPDTILLARHCADIGIQFMSTPGDPDSLRFLVEECGVDAIKLGSGDLTNWPLIEQARATGKNLLLSTGMATMQEVEAACRHVPSLYPLVLLHCVSAYPCPDDQANVSAIWTLAKHFPGVPVGYSDHTVGTMAALTAVACGASVIEKHLTLDVHEPGPDQATSAMPMLFHMMVGNIRQVEKVMGHGHKIPMPCERQNIIPCRKSVYATATILEGELFTLDNVAVKRPAGGIAPGALPELFGMTAQRSYEADDAI